MRSAKPLVPLPALALAAGLFGSIAPARGAERVLFDFENTRLSSIQKNDVILLPARMNGRAVRMITGFSQWPGITLRPSGAASWDLRAFDWIAVDLRNDGFFPVTMYLRIDMPGGNGATNSVTGGVRLPPWSARTLQVWFRRQAPPGYPVADFIGMRGLPGGFLPDAATVDPRRITELTIFAHDPGGPRNVVVDDVRAGGFFQYPAWAETMRTVPPFVDRYGQMALKTWPGKVTSDADLAAARIAEEQDLAAHPGPAHRSRFGGWTIGPRLRATGRFRTEKVAGKWYLVDPEGYLFFSLGLTCVGPDESTPITDRERFFEWIPPGGDPLAYRWWSDPAPSGYYASKRYENMDFARANLHRKFGARWAPVFQDFTHRRLRSWGFNTLGAWSNGDLCMNRRTPYTVSIGNSARRLANGFPDVFDPAFATSLQQRMQAEVGRSASDPYCLGYFIDNEIPFTWDDWGLGLVTLTCPPDQPAKRAFVSDLKAKYQDRIDRLNRAWRTSYASWDDLLASRTPPDRRRAEEDLAAFGAKIAEVYFSTCRAAVKAVAPDALYLGCRFQDRSPAARRAAARYCDVVSINHYAREAATLSLGDGIDAPILVGEFHFGALDRGPFHATGLPTTDQRERAASFASYVRGALRNPAVVGCHWFQFRDQPVAGRFDGENQQIGFVDICDNPYPEMVAAAREVSERMYVTRYFGIP